MASGKSFVGVNLAKTLGYLFVDLDLYIEEKEQQSITNIFKNKGELYFRKKERFYLSELLEKNVQLVVATGGGTPCYYDNMELIKDTINAHSVYLRVSIKTIANRLNGETSKRPLIAHLERDEELQEFIGKHLFERSQFYNKANFIINADRDVSEILEEIIIELF